MKPPVSAAVLLGALFAGASFTAAAPAATARAADAPPEASYSPVASSAAVLTLGHARFTVLTPQLIRMEWAADGRFEDHASLVFINRRLPVPKFTSHQQNGQLQLDTDALHLKYTPGDSEGKFTASNLEISYKLDGRQVTWRPGDAPSGNLQGTTRTLDGALGNKTREPIGEGLISRDGWVVVDDSTRPLFDSDNFDFTQGEKSEWPWVMERPAGARQDWYFFGYGHEYKRALGDYVKVAGRIPLPPRFAFGAWWSRYWAYSDQELEELVRGFHENNTPLDVFVIDMDWHKTFGRHFEIQDQSGHAKGWSGYSWDPLLFPAPAQFLAKLHSEGLKTTLNLHPASGVQPWEMQYPAMAKAMDIDPASGKFVPFDITSKKFATNYMDILHHPLEREGVDFWWLDWQQEANTQTPGVNPTWWLNYVHFTDQEREGKRPLLFHRWGGLGNHRYQIGFSGDTISQWPSLAFQPWFTATAANVGYAYWSHDIGGHMPGAVDPELYTRWIQFGIYSPILRTHTTKNPDAERRIWAYPEPYAGIMRSAFQLRYAMQPYIYTEARRTYDTGVAFLRPLYYDWPGADEAYSMPSEYLFGDNLIVAPVVTPMDTETQLSRKKNWLPPGEWIEQASGAHFRGPANIERSFAIDEIPVYARAGTILPMQPPMRYTGEKPVDPLILSIFPLADGQQASYEVYEDDGKAEAYKWGVFTRTPVTARQQGDELTVTIEPVRGHFAGMLLARGYELCLPADWPPESVTLNGRPVSDWKYEGNTLTTVVPIPRGSVAAAKVIRIRRAAGSLESRTKLNGFPGSEARLRAAYDALNSLSPLTWSPNPLIDAYQAGDRMSYHPETARAEVARFAETYAQAIAAVAALRKDADQPEGELEKRLLKDKGAETTRQRAERYKQTLARAMAQLEDGKPQ